LKLDLPASPNELRLVDIKTEAKPSLDHMRQRLARIWRNLGPVPPWSKILMVGDMSNHLDGVMLRAMNVVRSKSLDDLRREALN
jgi:hypothetical protein